MFFEAFFSRDSKKQKETRNSTVVPDVSSLTTLSKTDRLAGDKHDYEKK